MYAVHTHWLFAETCIDLCKCVSIESKITPYRLQQILCIIIRALFVKTYICSHKLVARGHIGSLKNKITLRYSTQIPLYVGGNIVNTIAILGQIYIRSSGRNTLLYKERQSCLRWLMAYPRPCHEMLFHSITDIPHQQSRHDAVLFSSTKRHCPCNLINLDCMISKTELSKVDINEGEKMSSSTNMMCGNVFPDKEYQMDYHTHYSTYVLICEWWNPAIFVVSILRFTNIHKIVVTDCSSQSLHITLTPSLTASQLFRQQNKNAHHWPVMGKSEGGQGSYADKCL